MVGETSQVTLAVVVLTVALAIGWARGGSLDRLGGLPLRSRRLVVAALLLQLTGTLVGGPVYPVALAVSALLVAWFLLRNRGIRGTGLVALGLVANALVVGVNGAMPVSAEAAGRAGVGIADLLVGDDGRHELAGPGTRLRLLGDEIPVPLPPRPEVVSIGDVLVAAGLGQLVTLGMVAGTPQGRPRGAVPPLPAWTSAARPTSAPASPSSPRPAASRPEPS